MISVKGTLSVRVDPAAEPERNMRLDEELASEVRAGRSPATLRVYGWIRSSISIGRTQSPSSLSRLDLPAVPMVKRPTGGGAVLHGLDELTYAVAVPLVSRSGSSVREIPERIHQFLRTHLIQEAGLKAGDLRIVEVKSRGPFSLCFSAPVEGDLLFQGRKVAGSALRVWKEGLLLQGSVQGLPVDRKLLTQLLATAVEEVFLER